MPTKTVQIRLTEGELKMIDEKAGVYPSRSEAVRDYVRRAELLGLFSQFFDLTEGTPVSTEELEQTREKACRAFFVPKLKDREAA